MADAFGFGRVLVAAGGGDNMMGAIGSGNVRPGVCTLSLGTSGTVYAYSAKPFVDPEGEIAAFCDSTGGWLPLLCTMNVTNTTEVVKSLFGLDNAVLERLARKAGPGAGGLLFLPFIDGERVPVLPSSSAVFFGLDRRTFDAAAHRPVGHGGHGPQPGLRLRPDAGAGAGAVRDPGHGRRGPEPPLAPGRRRRLRDARRDAQGAGGRGLRGGPAVGLELALGRGREGRHRRHRRPVGGQGQARRRARPAQRRPLCGPPGPASTISGAAGPGLQGRRRILR
ncbi:MAG: hypothetical protein MZW92_02235 [Comamonadaceae bacterium]|nr:hypothetical protein [Comamonadaceae bacterium]